MAPPGWLDDTWQDLRYALRTLRKHPAYGGVAIATLALGIGSACAVFSLVNAVLLRRLPYKDPDRLVFLWQPNPHFPDVPVEAFGPFNADFYEWRKLSHSFSRLALFTVDHMSLATGGSAVAVTGSRVTADFFPLLGIAPVLGRAVSADDDQPGQGQVAVISHALWQARFGSDPGVLGRQMLLDAHPYRIIGVMPAGFAFPHQTENLDTAGKSTDLWVPWAMSPREQASWEDGSGNAIGRLRAGVSVNQAQAEMTSVVRGLDSLHLPFFRGSYALVRPFDVVITGASRRMLVIFLASVLLVLLIACGNVASLVLTRAAGRSLEIGVRTALGASRLRLVRQLLWESLCLAGAGGVLGTIAAYFAIRPLLHLPAIHIARMDEVSIDWRVIAFAVAASLAASVLCGLFPAWSASRCDLNEVLKSSSRRAARGGGDWFRRAMIVAEVSCTFVLLVGAGLLIRSFLKVKSVEKGFESSSVVAMSVRPDARYNQPRRRIAFFESMVERTGALPGVEAAAAINYLPLAGGESVGNMSGMRIGGQTFEDKVLFEQRTITPRYFAAMGIPLLAGRDFRNSDRADGPPVAIVSRSFARRYFGDRSALGQQCVEANGKVQWTIAGVAADVRHMSLEATPPMQIYRPLGQDAPSGVSVVARTRGTTDRLAAQMRVLLRDLDAALAPEDVRTMQQLVEGATAERRFQTVLLTGFGGFALFLSLVGLYAVMSFSVEQRTVEIGIRMALGAPRASVLRMILGQGSALALAGIGLGCVCAWAATRVMTSLLYEVTPADAATYLSAAGLFAVVALAACAIPAARATRVDPIESLRSE